MNAPIRWWRRKGRLTTRAKQRQCCCACCGGGGALMILPLYKWWSSDKGRCLNKQGREEDYQGWKERRHLEALRWWWGARDLHGKRGRRRVGRRTDKMRIWGWMLFLSVTLMLVSLISFCWYTYTTIFIYWKSVFAQGYADFILTYLPTHSHFQYDDSSEYPRVFRKEGPWFGLHFSFWDRLERVKRINSLTSNSRLQQFRKRKAATYLPQRETTYDRNVSFLHLSKRNQCTPSRLEFTLDPLLIKTENDHSPSTIKDVEI